MKHTITFFAILMMALAMPKLAGAYDFSAVSPSGHTLYFAINGDEVTVIYPVTQRNAGQLWGSWEGYSEPTGFLTIPSVVEYNGVIYPVTAISSQAFRNCNGLASVSISK